MKGETLERWRKLCDQAATEEDPAKLAEIYKEIIRMLDERAAQLFNRWKEQQVETRPN